jgi:hypothetical protein
MKTTTVIGTILGAGYVALKLAGFEDSGHIYNTCKVTLGQFERLSAGMSYAQVKDVLGCNGVLEGRSDSSDYVYISYGWDGSGSIGANLSVSFINGRMDSKSQSGLHR